MHEYVYILMPVHNRKAITSTFIDHLQKQSHTNFCLVLIDDGSTDGTSEMAFAKLPTNQLEVIKGDGNLWWGGALQKGYEYLRDHSNMKPTDVVLMINDDTFMPSDCLAKAVKKIKELPEKHLLFAVNKDIDEQKDPEIGVFVDWKTLTFDREVRDRAKINCASTRGLFLRANEFLALKGFRSKLLPHYGSDYEFTYRAFKKGYKIVSFDDIYIKVDFKTSVNQPLNFNQTFKDYLRPFLWKDTPSNRWMWTKFIWTSCPWYLIPLNVVRIWLGLVKFSGKYFMFQLKKRYASPPEA